MMNASEGMMEMEQNLRARSFPRISIDFAHTGTSSVVGGEAPADPIVASHTTRREVQVIRLTCVLCSY